MALLKLGEGSYKEDLLFVSGNSLMVGNLSSKVTPEVVVKKLEERGGIDLHSLGFFDSTPDYASYYPGITPEELTPDDSDYITPLFRLLSSTIVNADSTPVDFSKGNVLKDSMPLLHGITIYPDHERAVGNSLGVLINPFWQNAYTDPVTGSKIPAGINGTLKIDGKSNPRLARALTGNPPSIHSNSVTLQAIWVKSHPEMSDEEFWNNWGEKDVKGELVRKIATKILLYTETSLVTLGADPYAQIIGSNGKIINPTRAKAFYQNLSAKVPDEAFAATLSDPSSFSIYTTHWKTYEEEIKNSLNLKPVQTPKKLDNMDFAALILTLGLSADTFKTEVELSDFLKTQLAELASLKANNPLKPELDALKLKVPSPEMLAILSVKENEEYILGPDFASHTASIALAKEFTDTLRTGAIANLKLLEGDSVNKDLLLVYEKADLTALKALDAQLKTRLEETMPLACKDCNSTNVGRGIALKHEEGLGGTHKPGTIKNAADTMADIRNKHQLAVGSGIFKTPDAKQA